MPQMFQQALWIGGTDQEDEGQEVDLLKSMTGGWARKSSAPEHFQKGTPQPGKYAHDLHRLGSYQYGSGGHSDRARG